MKEIFIKNRKIFVVCSATLVFLMGIYLTQMIVQHLNPGEDIEVVEMQEKEPEKKAKESIEKILAPVKTGPKISRYYYDASYDDEKLENALILFEGVYRPNLGVDYTYDNQAFDVYASLSGVVIKKTNDPLLGWIVSVKSDENIIITYQALSEVSIEKGDTLKQGDKIGVSGSNIYEADLKNHLHYIIEIDNKTVNPENYFNQLITNISS